MLIKIFFGLVEITFGLVRASYSLPERADFLCTLKGLGIMEKWSYSCTCMSGKNSEHPHLTAKECRRTVIRPYNMIIMYMQISKKKKNKQRTLSSLPWCQTNVQPFTLKLYTCTFLTKCTCSR